ncbi:MAG: hypothetical protein DRN04_03675 [Thermoprotei archaeon]|nr:MAG: hypothetical protein DRN04_03675 [Thermoprotei archaeon]
MKYGFYLTYSDLENDFDELAELTDKGLEVLHVSLPLPRVEEYYTDTRIKPHHVKRSLIIKLRELVRDAQSIGLKVVPPLKVFHFSQLDENIDLASVTVFNKRNREWACPVNNEVRHRVEADMRNLIETYDVDGILLDFLRYGGVFYGLENYLVCFCEECCRDAKERGFNLYLIKSDLIELYEKVVSVDVDILVNFPQLTSLFEWVYTTIDYHSLTDWLALHREIISEYTYYLTKLAKSLGGPSLAVGATLMAPMWSILVGQDYRDFSIIVDFIEPLLYFDQIIWEGLPVVKEISDKSGINKDLLTKIYFRLLGLDSKYTKPYNVLKEEGLDIEALSEIAEACIELNVENKPLYAAISCSKKCFENKYSKEIFSNIKVLSEDLVVETVEKISVLSPDLIIFNAYRESKEFLFKYFKYIAV